MKDAIDKGAEVVCGGGLEQHEMGNNFFAPTLLGGCTLDMRISHEEIFGPVVAVMKFKDADEALAISNRYGVPIDSMLLSVWSVCPSLSLCLQGYAAYLREPRGRVMFQLQKAGGTPPGKNHDEPLAYLCEAFQLVGA